MARWRSYDEIHQQIRQELVFAAAGIGDLVNVDAPDDDDPDASRCPECWWIWPQDAVRCVGCGYPDAAPDLG